ncbi:hypothetical protein FLAVO9AF_190024 [Flavobacterium sp. 9AF]|uniref:hypothetical protein n=1 Tax=Flavobacterium sp. 9AF TaxID=2653142 RepID=UPI0012F19874|nr:hypothetical protein [Flavobacterium sp. 9AF]VXB52245.1 hypothetical protein FLAVO9AF_190024 [Flavobacterium sp. 9AF]
MKKNILLILFFSLMVLGKEMINNTKELAAYSTVEISKNKYLSHNFNTHETTQCAQCHGCKNGMEFTVEKDSLNLKLINKLSKDTIENNSKEMPKRNKL